MQKQEQKPKPPNRIVETFKESWRYRNLLLHLVSMDLKVRYRKSLLGFLWTLLNPFLLMMVMYLIFNNFKAVSRPNFAMFLLLGIMAWTFFTASITSCLDSIIRQGGLLKKLYLPKVIFPLSTVLSQLVNFIFFIIAYAILSLFTGPGHHWTWITIPISTFLLFINALGLGYMLAALNVYFRDVTHIMSAIIRAWFYLTPVLYSVDMFKDKQWVFYLNPATFLIQVFRQPLFDGTLPVWEVWVAAFLWGVLFLIIGHGIFKRFEHDFIYYL